MAQQIKVTPEELRSAAKDLDAQRDQYEQILAKVQQTVHNVTANWQGDTQAKFLSELEQSKEALKVFSLKMQDFSAYLVNTAVQIERVDAEIGRK